MKYIVVAVDDEAVAYMIEEMQDKYPCVYIAKEVVHEAKTDVYHD
jgi:hypothetical protein